MLLGSPKKQDERHPRVPDEVDAELNGGLVYVHFGKGSYIYTGLAFFRQLPEGVPGAYRLFINLLSASRNHTARPPRKKPRA